MEAGDRVPMGAWGKDYVPLLICWVVLDVLAGDGVPLPRRL